MLELRGATRSYGRLEVLHETSFALHRGEICGYLGPNGSGKSTTVQVLAGLSPPTRGEVLLDGQPIAGDLDGFKRKLGYVPEEARVYRHLSGWEYLELVGGLRGLAPVVLRARIHALLDAFGIAGDADVSLDDYSKGMRQKSDAAVLAPLPVPRRSVVAAHAAALAALLALLTVVVNAGSMALMPMLDSTHQQLLAGVARQAAEIAIIASIAFGSVLLLRALALTGAGVPGLRRLGAILQLAGLIAVIAALLLLPVLSQLGPAWQYASASPLPLAGWAATLAFAAVAAYLFAANRVFRPAGHSRRKRSRAAARWLWGGACGATARFAMRTLTRCSRQRMSVGAWFSLGAGIVVASAVSLAGGRLAPTAAQSARVALGAPLVLGLFLLAGLRSSFAIP
ncbi:MAG: ATP-binding cassette domain-containing protein, partial [Terriglobales bacterium]